MQAIIFIGIQASGKSTFYQGRFYDTHIRINLDMLNTRNRERLLFQTCLKMKQSFVVDNTNLQPGDRSRYVPEAKDAGFCVVGYYFETPLEDALRRNACRSGKAHIPEIGLRGAYSKLTPPSYEEGFDELYTVRLMDEKQFVVESYNR